MSCLFSSVFGASLLWLEEAAELDEAALELEELDEDEDFSLELELELLFEELELELDLTLEVTAEPLVHFGALEEVLLYERPAGLFMPEAGDVYVRSPRDIVSEAPRYAAPAE